MRPIATKRGGSGGGGATSSRAPGVVECGHRPGTEAGPDGGRVRRWHQGQSATKRGDAEVEEAVQQARGYIFYFFMHKEGMIMHLVHQLRAPIAAERGGGGGGGAMGSWVPRAV
jgi:hypothetical protein